MTDMKQVPDEMVVRAKSGDKEAIEAVCKGSIGLVHWWALKISRGDPTLRDDMVGAGHLAIFDAIRRFKPGKSKWGTYLALWLHARMGLNAKKTRNRARLSSDIDGWIDEDGERTSVRQFADDAPLPDEDFAEHQRSQAFRTALSKLPKHLRDVMRDRLAGDTLQTIADRYQCSRETARKNEMRALWRLRRALGIDIQTPIVFNELRTHAKHGTLSHFEGGCRCALCVAAKDEDLKKRGKRFNYKQPRKPRPRALKLSERLAIFKVAS